MKISSEREEGPRQNITETEKTKQAHNRARGGASREVGKRPGECGVMESADGWCRVEHGIRRFKISGKF